MNKFLLSLLSVPFALSSVYAADEVTWTGAVSNVWDAGVTANFSDAGGAAVCFAGGNDVTFDDTPRSNQSVDVSGEIVAGNITFSNSQYSYILKPLSGAALTGSGQLTVNGGDVTLGVPNRLAGGTLLKSGRLKLTDVSSVSAFGKSVTAEGGALDFCVDNTSSAYMEFTIPVVVSGNTLDVYTSRYTYWNAPVTGNGNLNIYCGGERSYIGHQKQKVSPDWGGFSGEITLYPYKEVCDNAGFYGIVFEGNRSFNPDGDSPSRANCAMQNCSLTATEGTAIACENNDRGVRIGHLNLEEGSRLYGYYKSSSKARSYFLLGNLGTDGLLAGRIAPMENKGVVVEGHKLGLVKEGTGTYTITGNDNFINGGIRVSAGCLLVNNDTEAARQGKLTGGTGRSNADSPIFVFSQGTIGGCGSIASNTDVYGVLQPGDKGIGTLTFADFANNNPVDLVMRPSTTVEIEVGNNGAHDYVTISGDLWYYNLDEQFEESTVKPLIKVSVVDGASVTAGDEFVIMTARKKDSLDGEDWQFSLSPADSEAWELRERTGENGYELVLVALKSSSVSDVTAESRPAPRVEAGMLRVVLDCGETVAVYLPDGSLVERVTSYNAGETVVNLGGITGVVIVNVDGESWKINAL